MTRKIIATDTSYPINVPNGTILTVVRARENGVVYATVDNLGPNYDKMKDFDWTMLPHTFKEYNPFKDHLWKNLSREEKGAILLAYHEEPESVEYQIMDCESWYTGTDLGFCNYYAYRIKPEPTIAIEHVKVTDTGGQTIGAGTVKVIDGKLDFTTLEFV